MSLTAVRSPIYAHHHPTLPEPGEHYEFIDQGIQRFTYVLLPYAGSWEGAGTVRRAAELNQRPVALAETCHAGTLALQGSFVSADQQNIVISVIKQAEDNDDLVIRCYETDKVATEATIRLPVWNRIVETVFAPCEIKTFRIPKDAALPIAETDLLEWPSRAAPSTSLCCDSSCAVSRWNSRRQPGSTALVNFASGGAS